jgi:hypothetical protein
LDNKNIDITRITTNWHNNTAVWITRVLLPTNWTYNKPIHPFIITRLKI